MSDPRYLLDTSVCVSLIRGREQSVLPPVGRCAVSVVTAAELEVGVLRSANPRAQRAAVAGLLAYLPVLAFEAMAVAHYGEIRVDLERKGTPIGPLDLLIAAHARSLGATLVTGNIGEFSRVVGLDVLAWR